MFKIFFCKLNNPVKVLKNCIVAVKPSFHLIAHDHRIAENTASDRQGLYETLLSDRAIVSDRQRSYVNTLQRSGDHRRSRAILYFSHSSDPAIVILRLKDIVCNVPVGLVGETPLRKKI